MAEVSVYKNVVRGPRWCGLTQFIRDAAFSLNLEDKTVEYPGWFRSTWHVEMSGKAEDIVTFHNSLIEALERFNA
jgi:hypothetical protein